MALTLARVAWLAKEWREASSTDTGVQTAHLLAEQVIEDSCLVSEANASSEASRRQTLWGEKRDRLEFDIELNDETDELDLGDTIHLTYDRYGLDAGKQFTVLGVRPNAAEKTLTLTVWG